MKTHCKNGHLRSPENLTKSQSCKICQSQHAKKWRENNPERMKEFRDKWKAENPELDRLTKKKWDDNNSDKRRISERRRYRENPEKHSKKQSDWAKNNKEKINKKRVNYFNGNPEKVREMGRDYYKRHSERLKAKVSEYAKNNPHKVNALNSSRRSSKIKRTPNWLTSGQKKEIQYFYDLSSFLTKITKIRHEVDHIIPLLGRTVSGLHVPWNLQILTKSENSSKNNRFDFDEYRRNNQIEANW